MRTPGVVKTRKQMTREERRQHHHVMRFDVDPPVPPGAKGYWSAAERRKRARARSRTHAGRVRGAMRPTRAERSTT